MDLGCTSNKLTEYITDRYLPEPLSSYARHAAEVSKEFAIVDKVAGALGAMVTAFAIYNFIHRNNNQVVPDEAAGGARAATVRALEVARGGRL